MNFTNKMGFPEPDFNAFVHAYGDYDMGEAQISANGLILSPRQRILFDRHKDELTIDVSDMVRLFGGKVGHDYIARHGGTGNFVQEERLFIDIDGWTVSGCYDLLTLDDPITLWDRKWTSVWAFILGGKSEWEKQLNIYRCMVKKCKDLDAVNLRIMAYFTDWRDSEQKRNPMEYPDGSAFPFEVKPQPYADFGAWMVERVDLHRRAEDLADDDLPLCTDEERWNRDFDWAVYKVVKGKKAQKATRVFRPKNGQTEADAKAYADSMEKGMYEVVFRPGSSTKCSRYCLPGLCGKCNWWNEHKDD